MTAVSSPVQIAAWLEQRETPADLPASQYDPVALKDITGKAVQHAVGGRYLEALHLLQGSPYPQPFSATAGAGAGSVDRTSWSRLGLVLWMRGVVHLQAGNSMESHADLIAAARMFDQLIDACQKALLEGSDDRPDRPGEERCRAEMTWHLERLEDLRVDLACNAEAAYAWIHGIQGEEQVLRPHTRQMWQIIAAKIRGNEWQTVEKYLEELVDFSGEGPDYLEKPEVLALCGRALHQIHMHPLASAYLRRAVAEFHPRSHKQAAARWLLGTVQWCVEWEQRAAIENLQRSIEEFEQLQAAARRKGLKAAPDGPAQEAWYGERLDAMRRVLADRVRKRYP